MSEKFHWVDEQGRPIEWVYQSRADFLSLVLAWNLERFAEQNLDAARRNPAEADTTPDFLRGQADAYEWVASTLTAMVKGDFDNISREIKYPPKFRARFREHSPIANYAPTKVDPSLEFEE